MKTTIENLEFPCEIIIELDNMEFWKEKKNPIKEK